MQHVVDRDVCSNVVLSWDQHPERGPSFIYYLAVFKFAVVKVPEKCSKVLCVLCSRKESL